MPLSPPPRGGPGEPSPCATPKKHTPFHLWLSKKKPQPSACGVFVPHPPRAPLCGARPLEAVGGAPAAPEHREIPSRRAEPQVLHSTSEQPGPLPPESRVLKKSRAQPPEENKRKPVLGKLGNLFTPGRRRNTRNELEGPPSSNAKPVPPRDVTSPKLPDRDGAKAEPQASPPEPTDPRAEPPAPEGGLCETPAPAAPPDAELPPGPGARAAAVQQGPGGDSPQLEPLKAEGESAADAAAEQLHSSAEKPSGREQADALAHGPGEDAAPCGGGEPETARGAGGVPGSPTRSRPAGGPGELADGAPHVRAGGGSPEPRDARRQPPEAAAAPPAPPPAEAGPRGRAQPATVLTLDIYLSKSEEARAAESAAGTAEPEGDGDSDDMDRRAGGRRAGRRRRSQRLAASPGADAALPGCAPEDDAAADRKVRSPRAAADGGVAPGASAEPRPSPGPRAPLRGEQDRSRPPPAASPTKRRARGRGPEAAPAGGPRAPARPDPQSQAAPGPAGGSAEAARAGPRELPVRSCSLLPEIRPEHKRGPLPAHWDGRAAEQGRPAAADAEGPKPRSPFGAGRSTVTTKVTLPAKPKHVELNLKTPKNLDSLGNEPNPLSQPVHKGNTATKISLFENKRANSSPRHADVRGVRNTPASSKTFVGRAKLNLAKKAKEMEQPEKKISTNSHLNGVLVKEASAEAKVILPEEEIPLAPGSPSAGGMEGQPPAGQALGPQLSHGGKADLQTDADGPAEPAVTALIPVNDHKLAGEDQAKAAGRKGRGLENTSSILGTRGSLPTATPEPQDALSDSQPPAESSNGCSVPRPAPIPLHVPEDGCSQAPISHVLCTDLKVSGDHIVPTSPQNNEKTSPPKLPGGGGGGEASSPLSTKQGPEAASVECPSKVLVQVRSFMLPVDSPQDVSSQIIAESSEVREGQLPSSHSNELEVVSVASRAPPKEEVPGSKSPSLKHIHCREEHGAKWGSQAMPPASEETPLVGAQSQGNGKPTQAESSATNPPGARNHSETTQRPDQSAQGQDSPVSLLNTSTGSDDSVFDSSSDMEKFTEIIRKMDSTVCVPQKKKKPRVPNPAPPHFAMPPIHEDNLEKVFDPNLFTFGLGKKRESQTDMSPALHLMQNFDTKSKLRPKRASAEQSALLQSLLAHPNGKDGPLATPEMNDKENRDVANGGVKRSRLEKSALFSGMLSSLPQDRIFSPSVTSVNTMTTSFSVSQSSSLSRSAEVRSLAEGATPCGSDNDRPHLPPCLKVFTFDSSSTSHSGLKSPSYMEKDPQKEEARKDLDSRNNLHSPETKFSEFSKPKNNEDGLKANHIESVLKSNSSSSGNSDPDFMGLFKSSQFDPNISFSGLSFSDASTLRGIVQNKINPRPGKVVIYSEPGASEPCAEVFTDVQDCTPWALSPVILVKVVRGCWILYEKPNFEGHSIPLEEGELELSGLWGIDDILERNDEAESVKPVVIGSIRHVVQDYRVSQIDLFTEPEGLGLLNSYFDDTEELQGFGFMQKTCSIKVHWGTWLIYEEPGFQGVPFILEPGEYPDLSFWDTEAAYIGSMRPMKMGGRKVEFPTDPKVVIYEKPFFEGKCMELETEMYNFTVEGAGTEEGSGDECLPFTSVGSMKVLRSIWVAYEKPGFMGHQYLLEEGEYKDWKDWGGYNGDLQSLRPILSDFSNAHMIMYSEKNFGSKGSSIDVLGIVANLKETGYGLKTQSINVLSGVWVAYENPDFTGEQYILDKGFYTSFEDWGGKNYKISSVQPICLDSFTGPRRRNQIQLFSETQFQGRSQSFEETTSQIGDSLPTKSCRVLGGSWVAYDGEDFSGNQYVLEEGHYPCPSAMGCPPGVVFKSLRFIHVEFSEPTIILFEREDFKGKKIELNAEIVNLRSLGFNTQIRSVQVIGGIWVTYEFGGYRGRQFLLSPAEVPNWYEFSGCRQIGSLRPFVQKRIYFKLRNKATGLFMSTNGNLEDLKLLRIQVMEDVGADDQIWVYQEGCIKCRMAEDCCVTIVGSLVTSGSKLGLALHQNADSQFWSLKSDGRIFSKLKPHLVLDIKGGTQYDQNHIVLNTVSKEKSTQVWEALVL
ncbi:beta/gamma crystallin domain-containing protein 1 isoform X1 [Manis javanica]|uniref:beta/gamma crystallin domain-containing protein 1 isoform X1 n=1 Tax=Manis javanica TaxID=9974 RepID=UPI003C6CEA66